MRKIQTNPESSQKARSEEHLGALDAHYFACVRFVMAELDIGMCFCELALTTRDESTKVRNEGNANKALQSALRVKNRMHFDKADERLIAKKLARLNALLEIISITRK